MILIVKNIQNEPKLMQNLPLEYKEWTKNNKKLTIRIYRMNLGW
jgi:hypothetical protein